MIKWKTAVAVSLVVLGATPALAGGGSSYHVDEKNSPFYAGAVVGYAWGRNSSDGIDKNTRGVMGGGVVGYKIPTGDTVLAIEADLLGGQINVSENYPYPHGDYFNDKVSQPILASLRVKGSWGNGGFRPYLTGGIAWQRLEYQYDDRDTKNGKVTYDSGSVSDDQLGFTLGTGLDWQISDAFSGSFGYHYYRFTGVLKLKSERADTTTHMHTIRLGGKLNF